MPTILKIAVPTPLRQTFDYLLPSDISAPVSIEGHRVLVPFGPRQLVGIVVASRSRSEHPVEKLRSVEKILDASPALTAEIMNLCLWASEYYQHPIGEVLHAALPAMLRSDTPQPEIVTKTWRHTQEGKGLPENALRGQKQQLVHQTLLRDGQLSEAQSKALGISRAVLRSLVEKGLISESHVEAAGFSAPETLLHEPPLHLNFEQSEALKAIRFHHYGTYLLDGATGSGKTEVYLQAISRVLQAGRQALILVPEIGLTPQTVARFENRFNVPIVQLHSNVSAKQRAINWQAAARGGARIVIGTRLAIFTPMPELGIIIIDEEHDLSFKQNDGLRYSARDLAAIRAHKLGIPLILGSATPALESLLNAQTGRFEQLHLTQRAGDALPPEIHCLDMRKEPAEATLSATATAAVAQALEREEQVLVFINRRGFAPALLCHNCGWSAQCKACEARMTLHQHANHLRCHHCDARRPIPSLCPSCQNKDLSPRGKGTERVEFTLSKMFPNTTLWRVDQDSMQSKNAMIELDKQLKQGQSGILIGTQMLAKGHHFPKLTLAVLLDIDQGLFSGDFRGAERMGQLIVQVAGRAGRGKRPGRVLLQTYQPEHPLLQKLINEGYHSFAQDLLLQRKHALVPPYYYMAMLRAESKRSENAIEFLQLALNIAKDIQPATLQHRYLGPLPALLEKRNERYRFQLQFNFAKRPELHDLLRKLIPQLTRNAMSARTRWSIDVDPLDMS